MEKEVAEPRRQVALKSTGAIGDAVLLTAVQYALAECGYDVGLISPPFTKPLWAQLNNVFSVDEFPSALKIDISQYLSNFPHTADLLPGSRGHLCHWMGRVVSQQLGIELTVSPDRVRISLTSEEISLGNLVVHEVSTKRDGRPVVLISPNASTKNRNLPVETVKNVADDLNEIAVPCLLGPVLEQYESLGLPMIKRLDLRETAAILLAADCVVAIDSGPLHLAAAAVQGNPYADKARPEKIIVVVGSSDPKVVAYKGNQVVVPTGVECGLVPCGAHGYHDLPEYSTRLGKDFHPSGVGKDKSGCALDNYSKIETAACMMAVSADEITRKVAKWISSQKR